MNKNLPKRSSFLLSNLVLEELLREFELGYNLKSKSLTKKERENLLEKIKRILKF
jgi:ribonuclease HII